MESKQSSTEDFSSAKAVLLGALAPGVNGPTWNTLKISFLMLGLCLAAMLGLAFSSSDSALLEEVVVLRDGNGDFTKASGCELDVSDKPIGLGVRSRRYAMYVEDGVVKILNLEEGGAFNVSSAEDMLKAL
ncbi:unnamed protein product [Fraxinus pennsylvanica]|uniref:Uncharacterized protein n=1 Tax=Fraxinus pennsylvanica TaxID=56036 RepID=A0AAD2EDK3_9LAMI|nr:unnamed protein product [Fraxinus pennsylvanica]